MTKATEAVYNKLINAIADESAKLGGADYYDLLQELHSHIRCLMDCYEDENAEK